MAIMADMTAAAGGEDQVRFLADVTRLLEGGDDVEAALDEVGRSVVANCADIVVVALTGDDGDLHPVVLRYADPVLAASADLLHELIRPVPEGIVELALLGAPALIEDVESHAERPELDAATRRCLHELEVASVAACPIQVREETLGVLLAATTFASGRRLVPFDRDLLSEVASRAGRALENDRLFSTLRAAEDRFLAAFEHAPIGMALLAEDASGALRCFDVNPSLCHILDRRAGELVGRPATTFLPPAHHGGSAQCSERRFVRPDGEVRHCCVHWASLDDGKGTVVQVLDVTDHRRDQDRLAHLTSHDGLTGLLNRSGFERAVQEALEDDQRTTAGSVVVLDLDGFSHLNDTHGTAAGDALLRLVARTLSGRLRAADAVGRLGDDEFGVLLASSTAASAAHVATELMASVRNIAMPVGDEVVCPTVSAGVRTFGQGSGSARELIATAEAAVLDAKELGLERLCFASSGTGAGRSCRQWAQRVRQALAEDRFVLHEQPIMAVGSRTIVRSELLVRMLDDDDQLVEPARFLPAAERYGQVQELDLWVVRRALELLAARRAQGIDCPVNVNLSGESLSDPAAVDAILDAIGNAGVDPRALSLEVTETAAVRDIEQACRLAARLRGVGCAVCLDDFGTGFSSFAYLKHLPVDAVKIDGQFIRELAINHVDRLTVQAIVAVSRAAGASTTAEYVEDEVTLALLEHLGVELAQGFHIGRPRPAAVVPEWCC